MPVNGAIFEDLLNMGGNTDDFRPPCPVLNPELKQSVIRLRSFKILVLGFSIRRLVFQFGKF